MTWYEFFRHLVHTWDQHTASYNTYQLLSCIYDWKENAWCQRRRSRYDANG